MHDPKVVFDLKMRKQQVRLAELLLAQDCTVAFGGQEPDFAFISQTCCADIVHVYLFKSWSWLFSRYFLTETILLTLVFKGKKVNLLMSLCLFQVMTLSEILCYFLFTYLFFEQHIFEFRTSHMPDGCSTT
jgi:hypothetical protein